MEHNADIDGRHGGGIRDPLFRRTADVAAGGSRRDFRGYDGGLSSAAGDVAPGDVRYRLGWDHFLAGMIAISLSLCPLAYLGWSLIRFVKGRMHARVTHG